MKLMEFKFIKDEHNPSREGDVCYIVKLSTTNERELYERTNVITEPCPAADQAYADWNKRLKAHLDVTDELVFYYIMEDEKEPKVGETFELDNIKLERIN